MSQKVSWVKTELHSNSIDDCAHTKYVSKTAPQPEKKTRHDLYTRVDADYYGYRDEDDGLLLKYEEEWERENGMLLGQPSSRDDSRIADAVHKSGEGHAEPISEAPVEGDEPPAKRQKGKDPDRGTTDTLDTSPDFVAHVPVPSQKEIEAWLVQRRQQQLVSGTLFFVYIRFVYSHHLLQADMFLAEAQSFNQDNATDTGGN